jgi:hypothetical protein
VSAIRLACWKLLLQSREADEASGSPDNCHRFLRPALGLLLRLAKALALPTALAATRAELFGRIEPT